MMVSYRNLHFIHMGHPQTLHHSPSWQGPVFCLLVPLGPHLDMILSPQKNEHE